MKITTQHKYYVYVLSLYEDGAGAFYVGKGTGTRVQQHIAEARDGYLSPKCAIIRHLMRTGQDCWYRIVVETDDEYYALWYEMKVITSYPYGALCNLLGGQRPPIKAWLRKDTHIWDGEIRRFEEDGVVEVLFSTSGDTQRELTQRLRAEYDKLIVEHYLDRIRENVPFRHRKVPK